MRLAPKQACASLQDMAEGKQLFDKELQKLREATERLRLQREAKPEGGDASRSLARAENSRGGLSQLLRRAMTASNLAHSFHGDTVELRRSRARTTSGGSSSGGRSRATSASSGRRTSRAAQLASENV